MEEFSVENIPIHIEELEHDIPDSNESEDEASDSATKRKQIPSKLSSHLKGLMGEANLRFARGDLEVAKRMCFEVIRQAPGAFEPYLTLAQIYENNNTKKYKAFLMLACHVQPSNSEIWCRLGDVEHQDNQLKAAITCYTRAIQAEPSNIDLHNKRMMLVQQKGYASSKRGILHCKLMLAKALPKNKHEQIILLCHEVAKEYFKVQNYIRAIEALRVPIKRIPDKVTEDLLNMMLELLLLSERYSECLDIFTQFCGFTFELTLEENMSITVHSYTMPENLHGDIKTKFIVCIIRLQCYHLVAPLIQEMLEKDDMEVNGMLFFDIAEALMGSGYFKEALQLLVPLVKTKNYSLAAVWLKHAECLAGCKMYSDAIEAYYTVIAMAPNHVDVLYPLGMLLIHQDRKKEALEVLSQDISLGKLHVALLIEQMKLLKQIGDLKNYWTCCELLLSRHCVVLQNYEELKIALRSLTVKEKIAKIRRVRVFRRQDTSDLDFDKFEVSFEPDVEDEYQLYKEILQFAYDSEEYALYQKFAFMGLLSKRFQKHFTEIYLIACFACLANKDYNHGYFMAKEILIKNYQNNAIWNVYSLMLKLLDDPRNFSRFLEYSMVQKKFPLRNKEPILGNYYCTNANYSECLRYFLKEYKTCSYGVFMIAMCTLQQYCQKTKNKENKKSMLETVTQLFFKYAKIRSKHAKQEAYYNLGRMYQQIGLFYLAETYYKKVLTVQNELLDQHPDILGLKEESVYNLHLIYKSSGNLEAARKILFEYIVI